MNNKSLLIEGIKVKQSELLDFLKKDKFEGNEIREWIAKAIVHFTEVRVPDNIVSHFLTSLDFKENGDGSSNNNVSHGPFVYSLTGYKLKKYKLTSVFVAFEVAKKLIEQIEDEGRIVSKVLLNELARFSETKSLSISLSSIQTSFDNNDTKSLITAVITSTDSLLNLIPELLDKKDLRQKIQKAYDEKSIHEKYSLSKEVLWSLNNARIIRNIDTHNPSDVNITTTFEAVSYTHLLNLLIYSALSSGSIVLSIEE